VSGLRFAGFPPDALAFYAELAEDNSKAFFDAHRARYEQAVRLPLEALLDEAFAEFGDAKAFRPNRDVRFSKDKSPYKLAAAAVTQSGCYVQLSAEGLLVGAGFYDLSRDQLQRYRAAVEHERHGPALEAICADLRQAGLELHGEELKRAPRGTDPDHPRIALLRHRRVYCGRSWPPGRWLHTHEAAERTFAAWRAGRPLAGWLQEHVGPPQDRARAPR
jgi:uncharacterized protein (TIGR02453 family)